MVSFAGADAQSGGPGLDQDYGSEYRASGSACFATNDERMSASLQPAQTMQVLHPAISTGQHASM